MLVNENVGFALKMKGIDNKEIEIKVKEMLELVKLPDVGNRKPKQLSGGQQQRVALARAIICEPKVILLDEPLGALDAELRKQMQLFLKEIQKKIKITFIFITHDQEEAIFLSDRIAVLNNNKFEQVGTPKELYYSPNTPYLATFFGECNLFKCEVKDITQDTALLDSEFGNFQTKISNNIKIGDNVSFGIRPEEINLINEKIENSLELTIDEINFKGSVSTVNLISEHSKQKMKIQNISSNVSKTLSPGLKVHILFNPNAGNIFL